MGRWVLVRGAVGVSSAGAIPRLHRFALGPACAASDRWPVLDPLCRCLPRGVVADGAAAGGGSAEMGARLRTLMIDEGRCAVPLVFRGCANRVCLPAAELALSPYPCWSGIACQ